MWDSEGPLGPSIFYFYSKNIYKNALLIKR